MARAYRDLYVNILVAGESGQGKTTCIENLFASYHPGTKFDVHDGSATSLQVSISSQLCQLLARFALGHLSSLALGQTRACGWATTKEMTCHEIQAVQAPRY